ncbi:MAG: GAF domain-containing protein, partial [Candidatus Rokuibacteriota bacterium]
DGLTRAPELTRPITDPDVVAPHCELVETLLTRVFPAAYRDQQAAAAFLPFTLRPFYATPSFERLFVRDGRLHGRISLDEATLNAGRVLRAYALVLRVFYGIHLDVEYPLILTATDPDSGLERHFSMQLDYRFLEVHAVGSPPALDADQRRRLLASLGDLDVLAALLPPDRFVFRGFVVLDAVDVTDQEVLSGLKRDLIERESIVSTARFESLQAKLRTFLRRPDLALSVAAIQGDQVFMLNCGARMEHSCLFADSAHHTLDEFAGSIWERAARSGAPVVVDDLAAAPAPTVAERRLLDMGARSVVAAPLHYQATVIGTLTLGSPHAGALTPMAALKLREVLPLFSMAVRRSLEELDDRVQAIVKERCTAIHPAVEWRFRRAALRAIERAGAESGGEMETIVFPDVYPLYAASDIRNSSTERNQAIQADLVAHLRLAGDVVRAAGEARPLPALDELAYRIERHVTELEAGLGSGDEPRVIAFLRDAVEARFAHVARFGPAVRERIRAYHAALDARVGTVYRRRREFEESVTRINEAVSAYVDAEQEAAQAMYPHYFEKQQTDGIDYSIYVGASLVESGEFDELYVRNLRLWQLMVACGVARRTHALRGRLPLPLDTAHLILVQHAPLAIRFRFDEKRFDVDGAYNIRYQVVKKRIDKAVIRGTSERVTQPGRLAVVYAQAAEAAEYRQYLDYLAARGYVGRGVEDLELEALQGVQGLRALRVAVALDEAAPDGRGAMREAASAVHALR